MEFMLSIVVAFGIEDKTKTLEWCPSFALACESARPYPNDPNAVGCRQNATACKRWFPNSDDYIDIGKGSLVISGILKKKKSEFAMLFRKFTNIAHFLHTSMPKSPPESSEILVS